MFSILKLICEKQNQLIFAFFLECFIEMIVIFFR